MGRWAQARKRGTVAASSTGVTLAAPVYADTWGATQDAVGDCIQVSLIAGDNPPPAEASAFALQYSVDGGMTWVFVGYIDFGSLPVTVDGTLGALCDHPDGIDVEVAWATSGGTILSPYSDPQHFPA